MKAGANSGLAPVASASESFSQALGAIEASRVRLQGAIVAGSQAASTLASLQELHDELLSLAQEAHEEARAALERCRERLESFDAESERQLAETGGRVRSLRARLAYAPEGHADRGPLQAELHAAELSDQQRISERLSAREWIAREARAARMGVLQAGALRLQLSEPLVPSLRSIADAGGIAERILADPVSAAERAAAAAQGAKAVLRLVSTNEIVAGSRSAAHGASISGQSNGASIHLERNGGAST